MQLISMKAISVFLLATQVFGCSKVKSLTRPQPIPDNTLKLSNDIDTEPSSRYENDILAATLIDMDDDKFEKINRPHLINLNFKNGKIRLGSGIGESQFLCKEFKNIPTSRLQDPDRDEIFELVQTFFNTVSEQSGIDTSMSTLNIEVISNPRPRDPFMTTTIHFPDTYSQLGCEEKAALQSLAVQDTDNINPFDSAFVFTNSFEDNFDIANTAVLMVAQTFGISAETLNDIDFKRFSDNIGLVEARKNEGYESSDNSETDNLEADNRDPTVGDLPTENPAYSDDYQPPSSTSTETFLNFEKISEREKELPGLEFLSAIASSLDEVSRTDAIQTGKITNLIKAILPGKINVLGINRVITIIELTKLAAAKQAAENNLPTDQDKLDAVSRGLLNPSSLSAIGGIAAIAAIGGYASIPAAISAASGIYQNIESELPDAPDPDSFHLPTEVRVLPNFSEYLELSYISEFSELLEKLKLHTQLIKKNYTGDKRVALLSLLKLSYAQTYVDNIK